MGLKRYFCSCLMLLALLACARETLDDPQASGDRHSITAYIESNSPLTRTILLDNPGVRVENRWTAGDRIGLGGTSGAVIPFSLAASDINADSHSAIFRSSGEVPSGSLVSFYPYQEGAVVSGGKILMDFPATQHYSLGKGMPQPDPEAGIMAATGTSEGGLHFANVMAILKIGEVFDAAECIVRLEMRDPSGKPLAGRIAIDPSNNYSSDISSGEAILTLDLGDGVDFEAGHAGRFFMLVPARSYPKGIEITFVTAGGRRITRTCGASGGLTFNRGVIYPIGDVANREYATDDSGVKFSQGTILMTPEILHRTTILNTDLERVLNADGEFVDIWTPYLDVLLPRDLGIKDGSLLVFEATDDLPSGGVFEVTELRDPSGDDNHCRAMLHMTTEFAKAFDYLDVGGDMFDEEGNLIEDAGLDLDLSGYLSEVVDGEGNEVAFTRTSTGEIQFEDGVMEELLTRAITRADRSITTPRLSLNYSSSVFEASFGASLSILMKAAIKIENGDLTFMHFTFNPILNFSANFSIKGEVKSSSQSLHLLTLYFVPGIPLAPGVIITPTIDISASVGIGGEIIFSTSFSQNYNMGTYGFSYLTGNGFSFRHKEAEPDKNELNPELGASMTGTLYASATLSIDPQISAWGLMGAGIKSDLTFKFGITLGTETIDKQIYAISKLALVPEIEFTPHVSTLGGYFNKKWRDLVPKIEFDPIWERYIYPVIDYKYSSYFSGKILDRAYKAMVGSNCYSLQFLPYVYKDSDSNTTYHYFNNAPIYADIDKFNFSISSLKPVDEPWSVHLDIFTGTTNRSWFNLCLDLMDGPLSSSSSQYTWNREGRIARYTLMTIPAGQSDKITEEGSIDISGIWPPEQVSSYAIVLVNNRTGEERAIYTSAPLAYYWPTRPDGYWFGYRTTNPDYYATSPLPEWPSDIPLPLSSFKCLDD